MLTPLTRGGEPARLVSLLLGTGGLLALAGGAPSDRPALPRAPEVDLTATPALEVVDVRAGNAIVVRMAGENREVRLIGVYVPQAGSAEDEARPFLQRMLVGEAVCVRYEEDWPLRDGQDRYWAYVYRAPDGLFVNSELIRQGYARVAALGLGPFEHQRLLEAYERLARRNQKGVWSRPAYTGAAAGTPAASQPTAVAATGPTEQPAGDEVIVYVTRAGRKYHRADCQYVRNGAIAITLKEARARGLTPCSRCNPPK